MLYVPRMTEGLSVRVSESVSPRSLDTDDFVGSFPGRSDGSFRRILSCQRDFSHDPVSDLERAGSDPGVIVSRDALLVSFVSKVGLCLAFFKQVEAQGERLLIRLWSESFRSVGRLSDFHWDYRFRAKSHGEGCFPGCRSVGCPDGP
ncbi:unnamed protein product [Prunus armeniaca]